VSGYDTILIFFLFSLSTWKPKNIQMRKFLFILLLGIISHNLCAQDSGFGLGIIIGEPTGVSLKSWVRQKHAIEAGIAWSLTNDWFHIHVDYLIHNFELIDVNKGQLPFYFGFGANLGIGNNFNLGARVPVGLSYLFDGAPLDVFVEVVPALQLINQIQFQMYGGIGIRYWF
jgi:hypothetical protein